MNMYTEAKPGISLSDTRLKIRKIASENDFQNCLNILLGKASHSNEYNGRIRHYNKSPKDEDFAKVRMLIDVLLKTDRIDKLVEYLPEKEWDRVVEIITDPFGLNMTEKLVYMAIEEAFRYRFQ